MKKRSMREHEWDTVAPKIEAMGVTNIPSNCTDGYFKESTNSPMI